MTEKETEMLTRLDNAIENMITIFDLKLTVSREAPTFEQTALLSTIKEMKAQIPHLKTFNQRVVVYEGIHALITELSNLIGFEID